MRNDAAVRRINRKWVRRIMDALGKGMAAVVLGIAIFFSHQPYLFCILLGVVKVFADISLATGWGAVTDLGGRFTATMFSFVNAFAVSVGIVGSIAYGYMVPEKLEVEVRIGMASQTGVTTEQVQLGEEVRVQVIQENVRSWMPVLLVGFGCYIFCSGCWLMIDCTQTVDGSNPE